MATSVEGRDRVSGTPATDSAARGVGGQRLVSSGSDDFPWLSLLQPALTLVLKKGGLVALEMAQLPPRAEAVLRWVLTPRQLRALG